MLLNPRHCSVRPIRSVSAQGLGLIRPLSIRRSRVSRLSFRTSPRINIFNTRTGGGGGGQNMPLPLAGEQRRIEQDTLCKNFSPMSPKVRSPGQVKVKNGFLTLRLRNGHTIYPIGFKLSACNKITDTYNFYIWDIWYVTWGQINFVTSLL